MKKQMSIIGFLALILVANIGFAQKLILVGVFNTQDSSPQAIGISCEQDRKNVINAAKEVARAANLTYEEHIIVGDLSVRNQTGDQMKNLRDNLRISSQDVVWLHISTHGYNDNREGRQDAFPDVQVGGIDFALSELQSSISQKNPKLLLAMADACNTPRVAERSRLSPHLVSTRTEPNATVFVKLFRNAQGTVIASSSVKGQLSAGGDQVGGFFTKAFTEALYEVASGNVKEASWDKVYELARKKTEKMAKSVGRSQTSQENIRVRYDNPKDENNSGIDVNVAPVTQYGEDGK